MVAESTHIRPYRDNSEEEEMGVVSRQTPTPLALCPPIKIQLAATCTRSLPDPIVLTVAERPSICAPAVERSGTAVRTVKLVPYTFFKRLSCFRR